MNEGIVVRRDHLKWYWIGTFLIVALLGFGMTPWQALEQLVENQGVGDEQASLIAFVAGYTLPETLGFAISFTILMKTWNNNGLSAVHLVGLVFGPAALTALIWTLLGYDDILGSAWDLSTSIPVYVRFPLVVLSGYFNSYGWALSLSSLSIAGATAATICAYTSSEPEDRQDRQ